MIFLKKLTKNSGKNLLNHIIREMQKNTMILHTDDIIRITKNGIRQGKVFKEGIIKSYGRKD